MKPLLRHYFEILLVTLSVRFELLRLEIPYQTLDFSIYLNLTIRMF